MSDLTFVWIVSAIVFGVLCMLAAGGRGRDAVGWMLLGGLLGPAALIALLVLPRNEAELERVKLTSGGYSVCPECAELVRRGAHRCRYCGADLSATRRAAS